MNWCNIQLLAKRYSTKPVFRRALRINSLGQTHCSCYDNRADCACILGCGFATRSQRFLQIYSCYSISGHESLWNSCLSVIAPTGAPSEEDWDEASISLALSCTCVWQVYENLALLDRKQFLCLCIPGLLRLFLTRILLGFHHSLCQNLTAPVYFSKSCICMEFSGSSFSPCLQVVLSLFYKAVPWTTALDFAMGS